MRFSLKVIGSAGQGVLSVGAILTKALKRSNTYIIGYRETPSLIKGGTATWQTDICNHPVNSTQIQVDIIISLSPAGLYQHLFSLKPNGTIIHGVRNATLSDAHKEFIAHNNIQVIYLAVEEYLASEGLPKVMSNTYILSAAWRVLDMPFEYIGNGITEQFHKKPEVLESNMKVSEHAYNSVAIERTYDLAPFLITTENHRDDIIIDGLHALSLGAIYAGARAYFAYPMSPSSHVLTHLANHAKDTGMLVKQADDEITAAIMTAGAMHMGTRAFTATSGGGYDLMTEAVSMVSITETPWVCVLGQRPGPATGLPTWTCQADLQMAIYSGHGESPKCILAASDINSYFRLIGEAFNIAERYQIAVILLTEKLGLETYFQTPSFDDSKGTIDRGEVITNQSDLDTLTGMERYSPETVSGISPRWYPGMKAHHFDANTDEHIGDGSTTEESAEAIASIDKRMRKLETLRTALPAPKLSGNTQGKILFVCWGSTNLVLQDAQHVLRSEGKEISFLHYEYLWPLRTDTLKSHFDNFEHVILIEGNKTGQLGILLKQEADFFCHFDETLLKYDGRPFFLDEIVDFSRKYF